MVQYTILYKRIIMVWHMVGCILVRCPGRQWLGDREWEGRTEEGELGMGQRMSWGGAGVAIFPCPSPAFIECTSSSCPVISLLQPPAPSQFLPTLCAKNFVLWCDYIYPAPCSLTQKEILENGLLSMDSIQWRTCSRWVREYGGV